MISKSSYNIALKIFGLQLRVNTPTTVRVFTNTWRGSTVLPSVIRCYYCPNNYVKQYVCKSSLLVAKKTWICPYVKVSLFVTPSRDLLFFSFFNQTLMTANCKQSTLVVLEYILYMASYVAVTITGIIRRPYISWAFLCWKEHVIALCKLHENIQQMDCVRRSPSITGLTLGLIQNHQLTLISFHVKERNNYKLYCALRFNLHWD